MHRLEYKYLIPENRMSDLRTDVLNFLVYDKYSSMMPRKEYSVRSIYFDTNGMLTYHQKIDGIKKRSKYRIRGYNKSEHNQTIFLEIKSKDVDYISKERSPMPLNCLDEFFGNDGSENSGNRADQTSAGPGRFLYYYYLYQLQPKVNVVYEREAFECRSGSGLRITFDKNLRAGRVSSFTELYNEEEMPLCIKGYFVLEVKFNRIIPAWLPMVLNKYNVVRQAVSKYVIGIDVLSSRKFY